MTFSRLWLTLFALGLLPLLASGLAPAALFVALAWYALLIALALADWRRLPPPNLLIVTRDVEAKLSLGADNPVTLRVQNNAPVALRVELRDTPPDNMPTDLNDESSSDIKGSAADERNLNDTGDARGNNRENDRENDRENNSANNRGNDRPLRFELEPNSRHALTYHLRPFARGDYDFGDIYMRVHGRLGMINRLTRINAGLRVAVYPNLRDAARYGLLARRGRLGQAGIRKARLQGAGREFESLRDYQPDDEMRRIDWKATARRGELVSRQYEVERSQNVMLVLDVGRTMLALVDGVQKLDYAINAALMLTYAAVESEDNVGLLVFADTVQAFLPPRKGRAQIHAIIEALHNAHADLVEPDYANALAFLQARFRRRSLMVCFTDLWDPDSSRMTIAELASLQPRHVVAAVTLMDTNLQRMADQSPPTLADAYEKTVAVQTLNDRQRALAALRGRGVLIVDSPAEKLSADLVNRYLEVKEQSRL